MNARTIALGVSMIAGVAGLAVAYVPALSTAIDAPTELPFLIGLTAVAVALLRGRDWLSHEDSGHQPVERERPTGAAVPGESFDDLLARAPAMGTGGGSSRLVMVRQSLREAAIDALTGYQGYTPAQTRAALDEGTWTDDQYAVEFFTTTTGAGNSVTESVTSTFYGTGPFHRRADHAAREIERQSRGESQ